jgi:hypothetical protein
VQAILGDLRRLGVVYTPPAVTEPMVRVALAPLVHGRSVDELLALQICDPAIGEGAFLRAALDLLVEHLVGAGLDDAAARARAPACVFGVDIDPRAVAIARAALGVGPSQLQVGDALALDWAGGFPAASARGGFDAVIGNPPYVRQEHLAADKPRLRRFASFDGVADLYVYFIELAHQLARPGGRYCLITPNKWLTAGYARALRGYLAAQRSVEGMVDLGRSALFGDADAFPCVVWGTVGGAPEPAIRAARLAPGAAVTLDGVGAPHARERWGAEPWHIDLPAERALIDRLEARWPALGVQLGARPARGVVTGCNRAFVIDRATRDRLVADEPAAAALIRPLARGRDVRRWRSVEASRWILLVDRGTSLAELPVVEAHLARFRAALEPRPSTWLGGAWPGRKPGRYRWYELQDPVGAEVSSRAPRLLYQDIQTHPACALDGGGELIPDTTVWILPTADLVVLAVLNSPVYGWYARRRFPPALNGAVRPKLAYLSRLPLPTLSAPLRAQIEQLATARLALAGRPDERPGDPRELDAALAAAVCDAYELSAAERALLAAPARDR